MSNMLSRMKAAQKARQKSFNNDPSIYAFWKLEYGQSSVLRFLPYYDPVSEGFWTEKKMVPMQFIDPNDESKMLKYSAPCSEMYDRSKTCPILDAVRAVYSEAKQLTNAGQKKDAERLEKIAAAHWVSATFYYQAFVIDSGIDEETVPENPIRIIPLGKKLHKMMYDSVFEEPDEPFDFLPTGEFDMDDVNAMIDGKISDEDLEGVMRKFDGYNFSIKKSKQGEYADWTSGSKWLVKNGVTPLTAEQIAAIHQYGYHDLSKKLPERPTEAQIEIMQDMIQVSLGRLLGTDPGYWNPEWEEADIKPYRPKSDKSDDADGEGSETKSSARKPVMSSAMSKVRAATDKRVNDDGDSPKVSETLSKITAARSLAGKTSVKKPDPEPESEPEVVSEPESEPVVNEVADETPAKSAKRPDISALASRISARVNKAQ